MNDPAQDMNQNPSNGMNDDTQPSSYVDVYSPPTTASDTQPADSASQSGDGQPNQAKSSVSQSLEDQNVFHLLGVEDGSDEDKEAFLDELQQVIWEDFLENDVELLLTEEEAEDMKKIMARKNLSELELQEELVVFLERLIPDLEEIMLEKALELKEDMVMERLAGMKEYHEGNPDKLKVLEEAEELIKSNLWRDAADKLNTVLP